MASAVTDYGAQAWANIMFGIGTLPSSWFLALCNLEPGTGWDGTLLQDAEPQGSTVYARQPVDVGVGGWEVTDNGFVVYNNDIDFGIPDITWGTIRFFALTDDATAGNLWAFGEFDVDQEFNTDFDVTVPGGSIIVAVSSALSSIAN